MKKLLYLLLVLTLALSLGSCRIGGDGGSDDGSGSGDSDVGDSGATPDGDSGGDVSENYIYNENSTLTVVYSRGTINTENSLRLNSALNEVLGQRYTVVNDISTPGSGHELVIGQTNREITRMAYKKLSRQYKETSTELSYVIYSDGTSVAIVFDEAIYGYPAAESVAIDYLVDTLLCDTSLTLRKGTVAAGVIDVIEWQESFDDITTEAHWNRIYAKLSLSYGEESAENTVYALKELYALYGDEVVDWMTNLYDPETGAFYYSNSARDNEGFLPDLESTYQMTSLAGGLGMTGELGGNYAAFYPEWMQERLVEWVRGLQDPTNGYFYHPQWGKAFTDQLLSRRGRDMQWAERLLEYFNASPMYDTPGGMKGDGSGNSAVSSKLLSPLGMSAKTASASVLAAAYSDAGVAKHLLNATNFREYLDTLDINGSSYGVGNTLESQATQIVNRDRVLASRGVGYRLADILVEWLNKHQNPETGLWTLDGSKDGAAINGLLKISSTYNKISKEFPNVENALMSAVGYITSDEKPGHICYVLNPPYAISVLKKNIESYNQSLPLAEKQEILARFNTYVMENSVSLIDGTTRKLALFRKPDGSFSYMMDQTASNSQGAPTAVNGTDEGDVNSTNIGAVAIPNALFDMFELGSMVRLCSKADGLRHLLDLENLDPVIKNSVEDEREYASGSYVRKYGGLYYLTEGSTNTITPLYRASTYVGADGKIESPRCEYLKVAVDEELNTGVLEYGKSTAESYHGFVVRRTGNKAAGNCFVFETDIRVKDLSDIAKDGILADELPAFMDIEIGKFESATSARAVTCEYFGKLGSIFLGGDGENFFTYLSHATQGYQYSRYYKNGYKGEYTDIGEWVTYTVELYDNGMAKYYVNNVCIEEAKIFDSTASFFTEADAVKVSFCQKSVSSTVWFDNTFVGTVNKEYKKSRNFIDYSDFTFSAGNYFEIVGGYNFNSDSAQALQSEGYLTRATSGTVTVKADTNWSTMHREFVDIVELERDGKMNKVLEFGELITDSGGIYLRKTGEGSGGALVFEADILLEMDEASVANMTKRGTVDIMKWYVGSSKKTTSVEPLDMFYQGSEIARIYAKKDSSGNIRYYFNRPMASGNKACTETAEISAGWHTVTMEMYKNGIVKYFLNGVYLGEAEALSESDRASLTELNSVKLTFADAVNYSSIFIDNMLLTNVDLTYKKYQPSVQPPQSTEKGESPFDKGGNVSDGDWTKN